MGDRGNGAGFRLARALGAGLLATGLVLGVSGSTGWADPSPAQAAAQPDQAGRPDQAGERETRQETAPAARRPVTVTLLTGDQVVVSGAGADAGIRVRPAESRQDSEITFRRFTVDGHTYVIPSDVAAQVAAGTLDRRLFDVTGLIEAEYDDAHREDIPLIVSYRQGGARVMTAAPGARTTRPLPAVDGAAVEVAKVRAAAFMSHVPATRQGGLGGGIEKIWLDGRAAVFLDESVPQIRAPQAWDAGYTGEGVTVGVLDTGIDETHPDLAGAVVAAEDFTGEGPTDQFGHGTHVASIITGSGEASGGTYEGVAPDAQLLNGKVCDSGGGCAESWILAGMEWAAVDQGADVINMSLGGPDTPAIDPMEAAVNNLTEQTGALFVIAAGNAGPDPETIASPGSADAALTVGAVDKSDQIADFSSRGPRVGDGAVKPDITAPGVDIVAARAEGTQMGEPVGDDYVRASGTSMATPHVVGAAAILAERRPGWTAGSLKSRLMGSARFDPELTVYDQGAGRVDVARAIRRPVYALPAGLSFGIQEWPHDDDQPVRRELTYHNDGSDTVVLHLSSRLNDPEGEPAPSGSLILSRPALTIPAGGSATVTVTAITSHGGPTGAYSGMVRATGGGVRLTTPVGVVKEIESYDLTLRGIGRDGSPAVLDAALFGLGEEYYFQQLHAEDGSVTVRVPAGDYLVDAYVGGPDVAAGSGFGFIAQPRLTVDRDLTWAADVGEAQPLNQTVEQAGARNRSVDIGYVLDTPNGAFDSYLLLDDLDGVFTAHLGPEFPSLRATLGTHWGLPGADGTFTDSPYIYALLERQTGRFWTGYDRAVRDRDLAKVRTRFREQAAGRQLTFDLLGVYEDILPPVTISPQWHFSRTPSTTTLYLSPGQELWSRSFVEFTETDQGEQDNITSLGTLGGRSYQAGRTYREDWNSAAFGPMVRGVNPPALRYRDQIFVGVPMFSDADDHWGDSQVDSAETVLYRNGREIAATRRPGSVDASGLPPGEGAFVVETTAERSSVSDLTTRQTATWSFRSAAPEGEDVQGLPLWAVRFRPRLDERNTSRPGPVHVVPVDVEAVSGADVGTIRRPEVRYSTDDGESWRRAALVPAGRDSWLAVVRTPRNAEHVSLRASATDTEGNSVRQTIIRAYRLP